jgi:hypothetical protein
VRAWADTASRAASDSLISAWTVSAATEELAASIREIANRINDERFHPWRGGRKQCGGADNLPTEDRGGPHRTDYLADRSYCGPEQSLTLRWRVQAKWGRSKFGVSSVSPLPFRLSCRRRFARPFSSGLTKSHIDLASARIGQKGGAARISGAAEAVPSLEHFHGDWK